ncbi:HNH endonuclease [Neobacillus drentensis]|uniref:HNH endonuclease n=1 Tax=Neobacillus drentensis TaxID=220684 RepID=UPI002FFEAE0C
MDLSVRAVPKPSHKRRVPKRVNRGKFSAKTIKEIRERDNDQCVRCGSYHLEAIPHHVVYKSQLGDNSKRNGVSICLTCHREVHDHRKVRKWFEAWVEKNLDENGDRLCDE